MKTTHITQVDREDSGELQFHPVTTVAAMHGHLILAILLYFFLSYD